LNELNEFIRNYDRKRRINIIALHIRI